MQPSGKEPNPTLKKIPDPAREKVPDPDPTPKKEPDLTLEKEPDPTPKEETESGSNSWIWSDPKRRNWIRIQLFNLIRPSRKPDPTC